ncbi:Protein P [Labeo rohita]|uniref:Protein P n=1 Tax=Labeo rohita TaxID=84645 RepID=A0ABQ8M3H9_LABRO|nr:Protein P [Labeo rohita]
MTSCRNFATFVLKGLRFAFEGVAYQYTVLPFRLSLASCTFSPLRQMGICVLNYLNNWLILAQSEDELLPHRSFLLSHLECLGLRVSFAKSALSPSQRISFLGAVFNSAQMRVTVTPEHCTANQLLATGRKRKGGNSSKPLFNLVETLLEWAQLKLRLLRETHVPGRLNQGADVLSQSNVPSEEWMLHPQRVWRIWEIFGKAEVNLFALKDSSHCPTYF